MSDAPNCSVCLLPVPVTTQIQEIKTSRLNNESKLLSNAKQLLDYDIISTSSVTPATHDTDTLSLASTVTVTVDFKCESIITPQFSGILDEFKTDNLMENNEQLDSKVKMQQRTSNYCYRQHLTLN